MPTVVDIMVSQLNSSIPVRFSSLIPKMSMFTLAISFDHFQFALMHEPNIPGSYAILLFTASGFTSVTSHIHIWVLFLLWLCPFILSGVSSPLISSSIWAPSVLAILSFSVISFCLFILFLLFIKVVSSAYLRLLIFLLAILIPACVIHPMQRFS